MPNRVSKKGLETTLYLAHSISKKLGIKVNAITTDSDQKDLWRGIREQLAALLDGLDPKDLATMSLGLSHSLSRYAVPPSLSKECFAHTRFAQVQT